MPSDQARQAFALWLLKRDRLVDAVQLAMEGAAGDSPSQASIQLLGNVLAIAAPRGMRFADAEKRINVLARDYDKDGNMLFELATLKHMQGESEAARRLYEQSIQLIPLNALAHNNLAMLLLGQPGAEHESLSHIEEALRIAGPLPELRDTYALVLACQGKLDEACRILRDLLSKAPRSARYSFHLAIAHHKSGNGVAAREALEEATTWNLTAEVLTPEERRMLDSLRADFDAHETDRLIESRLHSSANQQ
jgi:Flp pilus assembly protein TadD